MVPTYSLPGAIRFSDALRRGPQAHARRACRSAHDDIAFLQYTGGTTGVAKGAMLLHRQHRRQPAAGARVDAAVPRRERREVIITPLPLYHIFSLTANCLVFMTLGGENVLITNPRDIPRLRQGDARSYRFTAITGVNTLFNALLNNAGFRASSTSRRCS